MNKVVLVGNLTKDPELSTTNSGISVARFTLAVSRRYSNSEGEREADFINIVVWRGQAENCHKFLRKGSKCAVAGSIQSRSYDAQDGTKRYMTEVIADEVEFLSTRNNDSQEKTNKNNDKEELVPISDDELPF